MRIVNKPNFFIVGAPRCGTTALYSYLAHHPDIGMSKFKEPAFFGSDIVGHQRHSPTLPHYLSNFEHATGKRRIGEASTIYLRSRTAPKQILDFDPAAQIIIMLRNPIDVIHASHTQRVLAGTEHITQFGLALDSEETRYWQGGSFRGEPVMGWSYREVVKFPEQIQRYFDVFGRGRVHVILFDDFVNAPGLAYERVLSFLGLRSDGRRHFKVINNNKRLRSRALEKRFQQLSAICRVDRSFPIVRRALRAIAKQVNVVQESRAPIEPGLRQRLEMEYAPEVENLGRLLGRDLNHWLTRSSSRPDAAASQISLQRAHPEG